MTYYVGILDGNDGAWGVRIPDMPGCHGGGETVEAAIADATSAALEWIERRQAKGAGTPVARSLKRICDEEGIDAGAGESAVMIPVILDAGRVVRANISLDAGLLEAIDSEAATLGLTRSAFLAGAAREKIIGRGSGAR